MEISPIHTFQIGNSFPVESPVFGKFPMFVKHGFIVYKVTTKNGHISYGFLTMLYPADEKVIRPHENVIKENVFSKRKESESGAFVNKPVCLLYDSDEELTMHVVSGFENGQLISHFKNGNTVYEYAIYDNEEWAHQLIDMFKGHDSLVIADGHHRTAAYFAFKEKYKEDRGLFSAIMPLDHVEVRSYHRKIRIKEKYLPDFYTLLQRQYVMGDIPMAENSALRSKPCLDEDLILMYNKSAWKTLESERSKNRPGSADLLARFESDVLHPFCQQFGLKVNDIVRYISEKELKAVESKLRTGEFLFLFPPVSGEFLWESSHRGEILPAKSTWIEPRMPSKIIQVPNTI